ncbi:MAG TPA: hypothetical protein VF698_13060, partial [Thermoanaerobaculia bacterium]
MARKRTRAVLEAGAIAFFYRPRVTMVLAPASSPRRRVIVIGRKRLPRSRQRDRILAFVTAVEDADTFPSTPDAKGTYELVAHDGHTHLEYELEAVPAEAGIERRASWIVTVANPDPVAWGLTGPQVVQLDLFDVHDDAPPLLATPFPPALQSRFGERRFIDAGPEFLDHAGA